MVMVAQLTVELRGLRAADGEEPPRILHLNPRLLGDWSGRPGSSTSTPASGCSGAGRSGRWWRAAPPAAPRGPATARRARLCGWPRCDVSYSGDGDPEATARRGWPRCRVHEKPARLIQAQPGLGHSFLPSLAVEGGRGAEKSEGDEDGRRYVLNRTTSAQLQVVEEFRFKSHCC
ncbi:hypothetical protein EJB05_03024, partial [Eragrostis curvula]